MTMQRESGDQATSDAPSAGSALTEPRSHEPVDVRRLYELYARLASETDLQGALDAILAAACELTRTERGCIQLLSDNGARLELFAWRGYGDQDPFVARFRRDGLVCGAGAALTSGARLVVEDWTAVADLDEDVAAFLAAERIVASQSTPMTNRAGAVLGVLSTQMDRPGRPQEDELRLIDLLAWAAGDVVERHRAEAALRGSEARQAYLLTLSDALRTLADPEEIQATATRILGAHLKADRAFYAEISADGETFAVADNHVHGAVAKMVGTFPVASYGSAARIVRSGRTLRVADVGLEEGWTEDEKALARGIGAVANVATPLIKEGRWVSTLVVHHGTRRDWTETEVALIAETAERTWAAVERARAEEQARRNGAVVAAIGRIFREALLAESEERLGRACLAIAEELTGAAFSFMGEINVQTDRLDDISVSERAWAVFTMDDPAFPAGLPPGGLRIQGLNGRVLRDGRSLLVNDPQSHPDRIGTPRGHPPLDCFLGVPLKRGDETIGMIGLGNRPGGFRAEDRETAEALAPAILEALLRKRAEDATRASERHLAALFGQTAAGLAETDLEGRFVRVNDRYCEMVGRSREELLGGLAISDLTHPDDRDRNRDLFAAMMRDGAPFDIEKRYVRPEGSIVWVSNGVSVIHDADGSPASALAASIDVTERKRAEDALSESERRHRAFVEASNQVLYQHDADWSHMRQLLGGGVLADTTAPDPNWFDAYIFPEDQPHVRAVIDEAIRTRSTFELEHRVRRADGGAGWVLSRSIPVFGAEGEIVGWFGAASDVTARREAEEGLRDSEERFRQFGDASSAVLWMRDAETLKLEYLTPAFETIYGLSRDEALGGEATRSWRDLVLPEDRERTEAFLRRVAQGERVTFEYRIRRAGDGAIRWLRNTDFPLLDAQGRVVRIAGVGEDVSETRELAGRMKALVAELQHRTRNLMSVVQALAVETSRSSASLEDFRVRFTDRIAALARVQGLMSRLDEGDKVTFDELIETELSAIGAIGDGDPSGRVELDGPPGVRLRSTTLQTLALAIHELAADALKHGALSQGNGRLRVAWRSGGVDEGGRLTLRVEWIESGVRLPPSEETASRGFGRELIEEALPFQLGAETRYAMAEDGLRCLIVLPTAERLT